MHQNRRTMCNKMTSDNNTLFHESSRVQRKTVRISANPKVVSFHKVTDDEKEAVWYSQQSLRLMSLEGEKLAKKKKEARGLEYMKTHEDFMYHQVHKQNVINNVLCEQHNQRTMGVFDHERIALVSLRMTHFAARDARRTGKSDEKEANECIYEKEEKKGKFITSFKGVYKVGKAFRTKRQFAAKQC
uniref:Uncharacterized protein n=1 Tax=Helicotheca tamesis TaxID=374047 RepID=A0A7S2H4T6_9STRA|mmetsp:Transcript_15172/g.20700  ORF Transcript_15172/g.20700 Transcript_15172/m.20700 type:complete len:187 (+) Transcript_15172:51-611(+)